MLIFSQVELKCLTPGESDGFYPEHLPKLSMQNLLVQHNSHQFISFSGAAGPKTHPQPTSSVVQISSGPNAVSGSPVAQNTATSTAAPVPVTPSLTPPPSLSVPVTSASPAETPSTTAPTVTTPVAVATLSPSAAATAVATPSPASPTATAGTEPSVASSVASPFAIGGHVRVQLELEIFRVMQEGHGGWMDDMAEVKSIV
jgi:cytoskeletal protein RodZ